MCRKDVTLTDLPLRPMEEKSYRDHFYGSEHWNYFTEEPDVGPIILSLKQEPCGEKFRLAETIFTVQKYLQHVHVW